MKPCGPPRRHGITTVPFGRLVTFVGPCPSGRLDVVMSLVETWISVRHGCGNEARSEKTVYRPRKEGGLSSQYETASWIFVLFESSLGHRCFQASHCSQDGNSIDPRRTPAKARPDLRYEMRALCCGNCSTSAVRSINLPTLSKKKAQTEYHQHPLIAAQSLCRLIIGQLVNRTWEGVLRSSRLPNSNSCRSSNSN